jgi:HK97 family phage major capsid protein
MRQFLDEQFIDPDVAAVANVSPASILNGATNTFASNGAWTTRAAVMTDVNELMAAFDANDIDTTGGSWIMPPSIARHLATIMTAGGENPAFPGVSVAGGTFLGSPVIVSNSVPHADTAGSIVAFVVGPEVLLADDGQVAIDTSGEASLQMDSEPTNNSATPTATQLVSLWQTNSIGIRAERVINWARRRTYSVGYISGVQPA